MTPIRHVLAVTLVGWINCHPQRVLDDLREENRALKAQLRSRKLRLTEDDSVRL